MPIAIIGTGRSGTSLVSRMLNLCGLYLGEEADIYHADQTNEKGSWESSELNLINDKLLGTLGGSYAAPPKLWDGWVDDPCLNGIKQEAEMALLRKFDGHLTWGWKLPRASITLPFWQSIIPGLRYVICLRNPVAFARSLARYYGFSDERCYFLWYSYTAELLRATQPTDRFVTQYEAFFPDFRTELEQVLDFVGLSMPEAGSEAEQALCAFHEPALKHHDSTRDALLDPTVPAEVRKLYLALADGPRDASTAGELVADPATLTYASAELRRFYSLGVDSFAAQVAIRCDHLEGRQLEFERAVEGLSRDLEQEHAALAAATRQCDVLRTERDSLRDILDSRAHRAVSRLRAAIVRARGGDATRA